ncbi:glycoside hydrolase family 31 protein [Aquibacillus albus]|uniref:Alpha-glucosidase n=1 Tax=Aquibacillus albus TaxID=1168171 RepID=A0ABS2N4K0_9BACI|nr:glycoside hydrolase family 31 protein [Aquibacillus albus]MBM7573019.1 alpha-glucosidase [Aquibacillus albus]
MQDTSFAILPENENERENIDYKRIGSLVSYTLIEKNELELQCENGYVSIVFYRDDIVRIMMNPKKVPSKKTSFAVVKEPENIEVSITENNDGILVSSRKISLVIKRDPVSISVFDQDGNVIVEESEHGMGFNEKKEVICYKKMEQADHYYGFGEKTSFLDKRGEKMTMWNSDVFAPHNPEIDALYQSIPYFMTIRNGIAHGIFLDNTSKTLFDMKSSSTSYSFSAEAGQLDYYVFAGPTPKAVLEQYTDITGKMPLPPKWALGYHQSRYSYKTEQEVRELVKTFKEKEIPLDAIYLDIHYMDGYRVFTFDEERFPNPEKLMQDLKDVGIHVVPIVDPGVKEDPEYFVYQEGIKGDHFCKYMEGNIYYGDVWPGNSAFPDFTNSDVRQWWGKNHKFYTDLGIEGIWNDMNEPAVFNETKTMDVKVMHDNEGDPKTHRELHNLYGFLMGEATYEGMKHQLNGKRPFLLTRAGYAGVQRYASVWTGDNRSFWDHLQMALPMCMNLGVSGVPFCGPDVGGFAHDSNGELLARWTQFGTFTPYFRNHSVLESIRQEPWSFGEEYEGVIKTYIQERYVWLPYLYTLFQDASVTGVPVMRPLVLEYPNDKNTFNLSDQFMIGSDVIVAPILTPSTNHRVVYLPEGNWVNYWTEEKLAGGKHHLVEADLNTLPIFIKEGSIITLGTVKSSTETKENELTVHIYPSENQTATFDYYEDDGKSFAYEDGSYFKCTMEANLINDRLDITTNIQQDQYKPEWDNAVFVIHGVSSELGISVNGKEQKNREFTTDNRIRLSLKIQDF